MTQISSAIDQYLGHVIDKMRKNHKFILSNAKETYEEVVRLISTDTINYVSLVTNRRLDYSKHSMAIFINHVLMPFSSSIYFNFLAGNIPACFMELRFMLESLAKCYLADSKYPEEESFQRKLERLEQEMKGRMAEMMKELDEKLGVTNGFVVLWGKLSQDWVHMKAKGFIDKLVSYVAEKSDMPPWALVIPNEYTENDLNILEELRNRVSQFRRLLTITIEKLQTEIC